MDTTKEEEKADDEQQQQQQQQQKQQKIDLVEKLVKGKSCKGYLFYSSSLKSHHRNPRCIGIPRALPQGLLISLSPFQLSISFTFSNLLYMCNGLKLARS